MIEENKVAPASVRMRESDKEKMKQLCEEFGFNQAQLIEHLISTFEIENSKSNLSNRSKEIEEFQLHAKRIVDIYLNALEINQNTEVTIQEKFENELKRKEKRLQDAEVKIEELKLSNIELDKKNRELDKENIDMHSKKFELEKLNRKNEEIISSKDEKIQSLAEDITTYKEIREKNEILKSENIKLLEESNKLKLVKAELEKKILGMKQVIDEMEQQHSTKVEFEKQKFELEKSTALMNLEREYDNKIKLLNEDINNINMKNNSKMIDLIESISIKNKELLEQKNIATKQENELKDLKEQLSKLKKSTKQAK